MGAYLREDRLKPAASTAAGGPFTRGLGLHQFHPLYRTEDIPRLFDHPQIAGEDTGVMVRHLHGSWKPASQLHLLRQKGHKGDHLEGDAPHQLPKGIGAGWNHPYHLLGPRDL
ncbi:MAG: hypothetical protein DRG33_05095 [Deltaproteobacteria bacterium]|nr:MAG: hypothetical protein DRG33_05095 [Deltaproteobacteria bacterium]